MNNDLAADALQRLARDRQDEDAWRTVYQRFRPYVFTLAIREMRGAAELAGDATQEVFLRLVKYAPFEKLTRPEAFRAYLGVVTKNVIRRRPKQAEEVHLGLLGDMEAELHEPVRTPLGQVIEIRQLLLQALNDLPREDQEFLRLRLEGYAVREIAERLGTTANNAAVRLYRIRTRLKGHHALADIL